MLLNFDYDGVIVDSLDKLVQLTIKTQAIMGVGRRPIKQDFATLEDMTYEELTRVIEIPENRAPEFIKTVHRLEKLEQSQYIPVFFPGIATVLKQLGKKHDIVVITATNTEIVMDILKRNDLQKSIRQVMGGDLGLSKARRIAMAESKFNHEHDSTVMIGDAVSDIRQGKMARVKTVAVTWGFQSKEFLATESPDQMIDTPEDLLTIFDG